METTAERIFHLVRESGVPDKNARSTLAKVCGISPQAVRDWDQGKTKNINHEYLKKIAKRYNVTIDWLLTGKDVAGKADQAGAGEEAPMYADSIFSQLSPEQKSRMVEQLIPGLDDHGRACALRLLIDQEGD